MSHINENENLGNELEDNEDEIEITESEDTLHKLQIDELIQYIKDEADRIGGSFRSPGIKAQTLKLIADKIHKAR